MRADHSLPDLEVRLAQTRGLIAVSRRAIVASHNSITVSVARAASAEQRCRACLPAATLRDVGAAALLDAVRSALEQAVIDREARMTALLAAVDARHRSER